MRTGRIGVHVTGERWFDRMPSGGLRMKRVSAAAEVQFPHRYRELFRDGGAIALVNALRKEDPDHSLSAAWERAKDMIGRRA